MVNVARLNLTLPYYSGARGNGQLDGASVCVGKYDRRKICQKISSFINFVVFF